MRKLIARKQRNHELGWENEFKIKLKEILEKRSFKIKRMELGRKKDWE